MTTSSSSRLGERFFWTLPCTDSATSLRALSPLFDSVSMLRLSGGTTGLLLVRLGYTLVLSLLSVSAVTGAYRSCRLCTTTPSTMVASPISTAISSGSRKIFANSCLPGSLASAPMPRPLFNLMFLIILSGFPLESCVTTPCVSGFYSFLFNWLALPSVPVAPEPRSVPKRASNADPKIYVCKAFLRRYSLSLSVFSRYSLSPSPNSGYYNATSVGLNDSSEGYGLLFFLKPKVSARFLVVL